MDNRNYFTMAIPALLLGVAYLQPINAASAEDLPNVTGRMTITQQTFTVSGVVTDTNGEPIIGANVIEKGTTNGAVTDFDGKFSLSLQNKQSILVVTYIGYNTKEIPAGNGSPLTIQLQDYNMQLSEKRARAVAKELIDKYGISSSQITIEWKGSDVQPYNENNWNRVVIMSANN